MSKTLPADVALTRMQQSSRSLTPNNGSALAFADAIATVTGNTTNGSAVIANVSDTSKLCIATDPASWAVKISAGFGSTTASYRIISKTVDTLTLSVAATGTQTGATLTAIKAYVPQDECFAVRCKASGDIHVHLFNDPKGKITTFNVAAHAPEGMHIDALFETGEGGAGSAVAAANIIPLGI